MGILFGIGIAKFYAFCAVIKSGFGFLYIA